MIFTGKGSMNAFYVDRRGITMSRDMLFAVLILLLMVALFLAILTRVVKPLIHSGMEVIP